MTHLERLAADPGAYNVFLAMRVIDAAFEDAPRLGTARRAREDRFRLGQEPSMAFARTSVSKVTLPEGGKPGHLRNLFFGLFGPHGPLPPHLTEYARERERSHGDPTFTAFANMLTHRMMSLLHRSWVTGQPAAAFDRGENGETERQIAALAGYGAPALRNRDSMPDLAKRHFSGHLAPGPRHPQGLASMLSVFFRTPVRIQDFIGTWLRLEPEDRWTMGGAVPLGEGTSLGSQVWSRSAKFRIRIGPLRAAEFERFLPGGASLVRLSAIVRNYIGDAMDWDVNLILRAEDIPEARLGATTRLGQTSWIGDISTKQDADDVFISPDFGPAAMAGHGTER